MVYLTLTIDLLKDIWAASNLGLLDQQYLSNTYCIYVVGT